MKKLISVLFLLINLTVFTQVLNLPLRQIDAYNGSEFVDVIESLSLEDREDSIYFQVASGNVPDFLRNLIPVTDVDTISMLMYASTYYVLPDYLAVGCDTNYFLCPMTPVLAQKIANLTGCTLPTREMVDEIYEAANVKLSPVTMTPGPEMTTVPYFAAHDSMVWNQREPLLGTYPLGNLVGGHKKDVVVSDGIYQSDFDRVVIYGWHQLSGAPIQPLYNGHILMYADYSHGIRLVQNAAIINGDTVNITDVLMDPMTHEVFSDEGIIDIPYYPVPVEIPDVPVSFAVIGSISDVITILINQQPGMEYYACFSEDGINFSEDTLINLMDPTFDNMPLNEVTYVKIRAFNGQEYSAYTEVLAASNGLPGPDILIVNAFERETSGNTFDFIRQHGDAVNPFLYTFSSATNDAVRDSLVLLNTYPVVDYILGEESSGTVTLDNHDQELIKSFLNHGGRLLISGSEIGWHLDYLGSYADKEFYNQYLKAQYIEDAPNDLSSTYYNVSVVVDELFHYNGAFQFDDGSQETYNVAYPDVIQGVNGGVDLAFYEGFTDKYCAIRYEGYFPEGISGGKLVYLSIPFETIYPESYRSNLMETILNYFLSISTVEQVSSEQIAIYPNPFKESFYISTNDKTVKASLYDALGRKIWEKEISDNLCVPKENLSPGTYYLKIKGDGFSKVEKMIRMK